MLSAADLAPNLNREEAINEVDKLVIETQEWFSAVSTKENGEWHVSEQKWFESVDNTPIAGHETEFVNSGIRDVFLNNAKVRKLRGGDFSKSEAICWGLGKSTARDQTRVGGAPFVDQHFHWPITKIGIPLKFYAQIRLSSAQKEFINGIGDLVLLFQDPTGKENSVFKVAVIDSGFLATDPISVAQCKEDLMMPDTEFFGVLVDFLRPEIVDQEAQVWRQSIRGDKSSVEIDFEHRRHLFTICSFQPHRDVWPYVNFREFPSVKKQPDFFGGFVIADMGSIVVTVDACQSVSASVVLSQ